MDAYAQDAINKGIPSGLVRAATSPAQLGYDILSWTEKAWNNLTGRKEVNWPVDYSIYNEMWPEEWRPKTVPGSIADGITQFAAAYALDSWLYRSIFKLTGINAKTPKQVLANKLVAQSVINFASVDVDGYNLTNVLEKIPGLDWKLWSFFAARDDDSHYIKRLKGMIVSDLWQWGIRGAWYGGKHTLDALKTVRGKMSVPEKAVARAWDVADYKGSFKINPRTVNDATAQMTTTLDSQFTRSEPKSNEDIIQAGLAKYDKDVASGTSREELVKKNLRTIKSAETQYNNAVIGIHKSFETDYTPEFFRATQEAIANPTPENTEQALQSAAHFIWAGQQEIEAHGVPGRSLQLLSHLRFDPNMPSTPTVNPTAGDPSEIPMTYYELAKNLFPDNQSLFDFYNHVATLRNMNITGAALADSALELAGVIKKTASLTPTEKFIQGFDVVVRSYFRNALMSGPGTIWRTFAGNSIGTYIMEPMDTFWTGLVRTGSISRAAGEAKAYLQGCATATMDCWKILASYIHYGNPIMGGLIYDDINPDNVRLLKKDSLAKTIALYPERISGAINETAFFIAYSGELAKQFYNHIHSDPTLLKLYNSKNPADQKALNEHWKYFINRGFTDAAIHQQEIAPDGTIKSGILENAAPSLVRDEGIGLDSRAAFLNAKKITFIADINERTVPGKVMKALGKDLNKIPVLGGIIQPFYKVSYNMLKSAIVDHGPMAIWELAKAHINDIPKEDRARIWGQMMTGGLIWALAWVLAKRGIITPAAPRNKVARQAQKDLGIVPHALNIWGTYWPINNLGPMFDLMLMITDGIHAVKNLTSEDSAWEKFTVYSGLGALQKMIEDKTILQNVAGFINFVNVVCDTDSKRQDTEFNRMVKRGATTFIPAILRGTARQGMDKYVRNATTFSGHTANSLPVLSRTQPVKWDYLVGEPVTFDYNRGLGPKLEDYVKKVTNDKHKDDVVLHAINNMANPVAPDQKTSFDYPVDDQTFSNLEYLVGTIKRPIYIPDEKKPKELKKYDATLYQALDKLIRSDKYKKAAADPSDERLSTEHEKLINAEIKKYIDAAVYKIKTEYQRDQFREHDEKRRAYQRLTEEQKRETKAPVWGYTNTQSIYEDLLNWQ